MFDIQLPQVHVQKKVKITSSGLVMDYLIQTIGMEFCTEAQVQMYRGNLKLG